MTKSDENNNELSNKDKKLWDNVTRGVEPIPGRKPAQPERVKPPATPKKDKKSKTRAAPGPAQPQVTPPPPGQGGMDARTEKRLRQGRLEIESTIDLHGMRQDDAHAALRRRVIDCYDRGQRTLLVITGKGLRSSEPGGVLRRKVPQWLQEPPLNALVVSTQPAQPKHGGSGALYVRIRRKRD